MVSDKNNNATSDSRADLSAEQALAHLKAYQASGMKLRDYAEREQLDYRTLYRWTIKLSKENLYASKDPHRTVRQPKSKQQQFVRLRVKGPHALQTPAQHNRIEVRLNNGQVVRVPSDFDSRTFCRLVEVLESRSC